jgi:photosystem II stability/assembly factor-like uncharacterized protein
MSRILPRLAYWARRRTAALSIVCPGLALLVWGGVYLPAVVTDARLEQDSVAPAALVTQGSLQWISVGPTPLSDARAPTNPANFNSGRVGALAVDPGNPDHWLVGAGNGGIWQSRDGGANWAPQTDYAETLAIGAIAFAPSSPSIVYAGTGEAAGQGFTRGGLGMLKSVDGGTTWSMLAGSTFARAALRRVHVHPSNPDTLMAISARGGLGRDSREWAPMPPPYGVWKSTDGAVSWIRTLAGQATALEIDATNFSRQYAAIADQRLGVISDTPGAATNGVYRSTDGGHTWSFVAGPWGSIVSPTMSTVGRVELAMAPSNPNVLYASIQVPPNGGTSGTGLLGLYRTDNAWDPVPAWVQISLAGLGGASYCGPTKCGYAHTITVDPGDPGTLVAGGADQGFWRCTNCGLAPAWTNIDARRHVHSDLHAMAWTGGRLIVGTDGGVWSTTDFGGSWQNHNRTLSTGMFYGASLHPTNPNALVAGLRDFTLTVLRPGVGWVFLPQLAGSEWGEAEVEVSSSRPDTDWMSAWIWGRIHRTQDGGATGIRADAGIDPIGSAFVAPVRKCPANENVFLTGTNRMWRTNNFFNAASPTWSANGPAHPHPHPGELAAPGTILSIAFLGADATCNTYAWGNRGGEVQLTRNGGQTWTNLDPGAMLPPRPVNSLVFDPLQPDTLYVALSSFDDGTPGRPGHVFRTTNALAASPVWTNVSPPIDMPFNVIAVDPRNPQRIYAGSDTGLWYSGDGAATWTRQSAAHGLPHAPVFDIQINPATDRTVVFTYGRGAFVLSDVPDAPGTLRASATGNVVNLEWSAPTGAPTSYVVRAGSSSGQSNLADFDTGGLATSLTATAPNGTYFVRVHARNGWGLGPPSNEVIVNVGCTALPTAPGTLSAEVSGLGVTLSWSAAAGAASYRLEAGSAPGLADLAVLSASSATSFQTTAPPGTYYVRVRGVSACGIGPASNEVPLAVGSALPLPGPPENLGFSVSGSTVTVTWSAPSTGGAATSYVVEAGSGPGLANLAVLPVTGSPLVAQGVPAGTYFVRVRARNATGAGLPTGDATVRVP